MSAQDGVMAVWNDLEAGHEAEFEAWYRRQHVPERLSVPGFREARRYLAIDGTPRYCAFYWLDSVAVLDSPTYRERLANPTAWTQRMMPRFRNMARTPCALTANRGAGLGGAMSWIAAMGQDGAGAAAPAAILTEAFEHCLRDPACMRLQLWECDPAVARRANPEARLRTARDRIADWIVCIEAATDAAAGAVRDTIAQRLRRNVPSFDPVCAPVYRLLWRMEAAEAPVPGGNEDWADNAPPR
jgi:hypothetical protein